MSINPFVLDPYSFVLSLSFVTVKMATSPIFVALVRVQMKLLVRQTKKMVA